MSYAQHTPDRDAEEQAALWAARIDGSSLSPADRPALEAWLAKSPAHRALLSQYCQFSADLEQLLPILVEAGSVSMPTKEKPARRSWNLAWLASATAACAALLVLGLWLLKPTQHAESIATAVGQRQSLTLADGTYVELNAQTSLVIENGSAERRVRLAQGQAYFEVSKDKTRPFIVESPSGSVRVTGTKFDVRTEAGSQMDVTVLEGSVQVRPATVDGIAHSGPVALVAGNRLTSNSKVTTVARLSDSELEDALAWRQGQIVFDNVPLREALARFAHYHGRGIIVTPQAAELRIGGRFSLDDVDGFFSALKEVLPVRVTHDPSGTVCIEKREER